MANSRAMQEMQYTRLKAHGVCVCVCVLPSNGDICTPVTGRKQLNCHIFWNKVSLFYCTIQNEYVTKGTTQTTHTNSLTVKVVPEVVYGFLMSNRKAVNPIGVNRHKICATTHKTFQQHSHHCNYAGACKHVHSCTYTPFYDNIYKNMPCVFKHIYSTSCITIFWLKNLAWLMVWPIRKPQS